MKKVLLTLLLIATLLLTSCDAFMGTPSEYNPKVYFVGIGLDYRTWNRKEDSSVGNSHLKNTRNDLEALASQIENLADKAGYDYRFVTYTDFDSEEITVNPGDAPDGFNYNFDFTSWSKENPEKVRKEFFYRNIAKGQKDENGNPVKVSLRDFAEAFTSELMVHLTDDGNDIPGKDDIVLFYYTGHGIENGIGPALFYQTGDKSEKELQAAAISDMFDEETGFDRNSLAIRNNYIMPLPYLYLDEFLFSKLDATVITMFDCCYSGYAIGSDDLGSIQNFEENTFKGQVRDDKLDVPSINSIFTNTYIATFGSNKARGNVYHLTAAHDNQTSFDKDLDITEPNQDDYGAFTYQILKYLDYDLENNEVGKPTRKIYSLNDMYTFIDDNISYDTRTYATPNVTRSRYDQALFIM